MSLYNVQQPRRRVRTWSLWYFFRPMDILEGPLPSLSAYSMENASFKEDSARSRHLLLESSVLGWKYGQITSDVAFLSLTESELTKTESTYLAEMHRQSPKEKASKPPTMRRRKRPHAHLRVPHLEEVMSPVTTPTDEDVGHRIKHVAGVCWVRTAGVA